MPYDPDDPKWWMTDAREDERRQADDKLRNLQTDEYERRQRVNSQPYSKTGLWFLLAGFILRALGKKWEPPQPSNEVPSLFSSEERRRAAGERLVAERKERMGDNYFP